MQSPRTQNASGLADGSRAAEYLSLVQDFDDWTGAPKWAQSSRIIGLATVFVLSIIYKIIGKKYGVNWCSFAHASVVGSMSFVAVWLNIYAAESLTGTMEPLGAVLCQGPLTTFHSIVPAITMGYGVFDLLEGIHMAKTDFILHGVATLSIMAYFCEYGVPEIIVPMLLMEISTINLVFMGSGIFMSQAMTILNIAIFTINFAIFRLIVCPYLWWGIFTATWKNRENPVSKACLPWHFTYVVFVFGMFFNCLNTFWFNKIVQKISRKLSGTEDWKKKNHVKDV
mmetsp:Transcript_2901/g.6223  ORF Transcript_2901/g.6223 Transcript_2901/m.6223 type:complete len:283 (+) Transcript_2901:208-1056(+)